MLILLIVIVFVIYCLKKTWDFLRIIHLLSKFESPESPSFILGHCSIFRKPPEKLFEVLKELSEKFYPHFHIRMFNIPCLMVLSPEDCEVFLSTKKHITKSSLYDILIRWLRDGLLLSSGEKWQTRRKILTPAFHFNILKDFISVFNEKSDDFVTMLREKGTEAIDVIPGIHEFALRVITETAMGHKFERHDKNLNAYLKAIARMEEVFNQLLVRPWLRYSGPFYYLTSFYRQEKKSLRVVHNFTESIVKEKLKRNDDNCSEESIPRNDEIYFGKKKRRLAMLDILIQAHREGNQINYEGICEEVDTFTFEGHDTISTALSFCMMNIANHPKIQNQVLEELNCVLDEEKRHPSYDDLQNMDLLERCIKETLRLYSSVHMISRIVEEDTILSCGLVVPKNTSVFIPILYVHRNPEIYPDPEKFDPDRFLPENCQQRHPFAYIPFSAGPRNCIGQRFAMLEIKALLSAVIRKFQLVPVDTPDTIKLKLESILRTKSIKVKFIPRI